MKLRLFLKKGLLSTGYTTTEQFPPNEAVYPWSFGNHEEKEKCEKLVYEVVKEEGEQA